MKLSVVMITYGQEQFIAEAIDGVLMQECNFDFELIISNDCSPDNTNEIICNYINNHQKGESIQYINHKQNIGAITNFVNTLLEAKGEYIAICEGDDYWTDPLKLQKQINFLENNPDFSLCFHQGTSYYQNSKKKENFISNKNVLNGIVTSKEIIQLGGNLCPTNSIVYRNRFNEFPSFFYKVKSGDRALSLLLMLEGKSKYLDENMCVYRIHDGGISRNLNSSGIIAFKDSNIKLLENFNHYSKFRFDKEIKEEISSQVRNIVLFDFKYLFKLKYIQKIKIKHLFLAFVRIILRFFKQ